MITDCNALTVGRYETQIQIQIQIRYYPIDATDAKCGTNTRKYANMNTNTITHIDLLLTAIQLMIGSYAKMQV